MLRGERCGLLLALSDDGRHALELLERRPGVALAHRVCERVSDLDPEGSVLSADNEGSEVALALQVIEALAFGLLAADFGLALGRREESGSVGAELRREALELGLGVAV
jgi:hypothetical protein